ncbi:MAG: DNA polymerase III subunit alpha [Micrococcales bacterium]|nr:DNA polymerase III subunit alpha [Micrococcales bacterium]
MSGGFAHLHVASGFSMRYGASMPEQLVERAAEQGQHALALTDRDGLYGAVRFAQAATKAGLATVLGVDLAVVDPSPAPFSHSAPRSARPARTPVRGGQLVDPRHPRVTALARGGGLGMGVGEGWAALCRLVTETHLGGERGRPVTTPDLLARYAPGLVVLLGPDSDVGRALLRRHTAQARGLLAQWQRRLPPGALAIEVVCHGGPEGSPASVGHAARLLGLADEAGVPAVLTAAVRHVGREQAATADLLDAARRLVPLSSRHLDRVTDAGHLADTATMERAALQVCERLGPSADAHRAGPADRARRLIADTLALADGCTLDPRADLGIGSVHLPEPGVLGIRPGQDPQQVLQERCAAAISRRYPHADAALRHTVEQRLRDELDTVAQLGYATYFLAVAAVTDLIRDMGVRAAARGSGAGSLVNYLLGISGVDPVRYHLLMERFCTPLRAQLPDIDVDVESARRTEVYERILERFGGDRVTCVSMMDTYKVRHAVRDAGSALGMDPVEIDEIAKAFPHIRARDARQAILDLPELRARGLDSPRLERLLDLVESLDGLPRHVALHPCGVILSNSGLLDRTPVEASWLGFPMSQFDKDDVETLGLLKLDILGIRMQSAMAHAVAEVERVDEVRIDLDDQAQVPLDDEETYRLIRTTHTLGCFQIESPGQRELIGKFGPVRFEDLIIDISLFRPGPVKSDMINPFLRARHGWDEPDCLHPRLVSALAETEGVVVFHEQILLIVAETTGVSLAQADEVRRALGTPQGQDEIEAWWRPAARARGYTASERDRIWEVLRSFASFGFCKAHAAAFALPTYHSAWLKTHHPAAFLAGVLTHDPGMYPKRLILDDARSLGIAVLGLDVNRSDGTYRIERVEPGSQPPHQRLAPVVPARPQRPDLPDGSAYGIRLSFADVKGMSEAEIARAVAGQPYADLADFVRRAEVSYPVAERLVLAGAFDALHGVAGTDEPGHRGRTTRRDLLLHLAELDRWGRAHRPRGRARGSSSRGRPGEQPTRRPRPDSEEADLARLERPDWIDVRGAAAAQSQAAAKASADAPVQLALDLGDRPELRSGTGLPELSGPERVRAELDILGLDASGHVVDFYAPMLEALGVTRSRDLLGARSRSTVLVCGVKVATQTPPVRSGRRVVFLTLDDATGPVDATFFEDVQGPYAATVFHSWMLLVRGELRRTGERGVSVRATGAWELSELWQAWREGGLDAVRVALEAQDSLQRERADQAAPTGPRRVLRHASGFRQSPYADTRPAGASVQNGRALPSAVPDPAGGDVGAAPRKLWHASPGSSGH